MPKTVWRYGVKCLGVKKRCRKIDSHFTDKKELGEDEVVNSDVAISRARKWIFENMKTCQKANATATLWTLSDDGIGEVWEPFTKEHNLSWPVTL
jgi:hypothetical protein